jgi:hypothetical protein
VLVSLAGALAAVIVSASSALGALHSGDRGCALVRALLADGLESACEELRWAPGVTSVGSEFDPWSTDPEAVCQVTCVRQAPTGGVEAAWPRFILQLRAREGGYESAENVLVELRQVAPPGGVSVAGDVEVVAPLDLRGSGVYAGGSLEGRQYVTFGPRAQDANDLQGPPDDARPERWAVAGVHCGGGIFRQGVDIHAGGGPPPPADTDVHDGGLPTGTVLFPDEAVLTDISTHAVAPGVALEQGVLHLENLPGVATASGPGPWSASGCADLVVAVSAPDGGLIVCGERPRDACPLTLLVDGDVTVGGADDANGFEGSFIVNGTLTVQGPLHLRGHVAARRLVVDAPTSVETPWGWRGTLHSGTTEAVVLARGAS